MITSALTLTLSPEEREQPATIPLIRLSETSRSMLFLPDASGDFTASSIPGLLRLALRTQPRSEERAHLNFLQG